MSVNAELLCPTTNQECPALKNLHNLYVGNQDAVDHETATRDRLIYTVKFTEMCGAATLRACTGPEDNVCPTREAMDSSAPRRTIVGALRYIVGR